MKFTPEIYLTEWWGECQTCRFWNNDNIDEHHKKYLCMAPTGPFYKEGVYSWGYCKKWDPRWVDLAFELMEKWNKNSRFGI